MDKPRAAATRCCMCHFKRNSSIALREKEREREKKRERPQHKQMRCFISCYMCNRPEASVSNGSSLAAVEHGVLVSLVNPDLVEQPGRQHRCQRVPRKDRDILGSAHHPVSEVRYVHVEIPWDGEEGGGPAQFGRSPPTARFDQLFSRHSGQIGPAPPRSRSRSPWGPFGPAVAMLYRQFRVW